MFLDDVRAVVDAVLVGLVETGVELRALATGGIPPNGMSSVRAGTKNSFTDGRSADSSLLNNVAANS
jgi:hypothetical protein